VRTAKRIAFVLASGCLVVAAASLLGRTTITFCAGSDCSSVDCGSPAFPNELIDFDNPDDAANCAGATSAAPALYLIVVAGLGFGAAAVLSARSRQRTIGQAGDRTAA
jgi:hypothetical protein